jgi:glutathione peroxidase-family protein
MSAKALEGRVFDLWRHFQALSQELQTDVGKAREHLLSNETKAAVFKTSGAGKVPTATGSAVLEAVEKKLQADSAPDASKAYAQRVADGLVQSGFLFPQKDAGKGVLEGFAFDKGTFLGVGEGLVEDDAKSVWTVRDGAIQAGTLQRKRAGLVAKLTGGKQASYVVANDKHKAVYVFDSELGQQAVTTIDVSAGTVEFDSSLPNGIKVSNAKVSEVFGTDSKEKQDEWLNSFINAGAQYREAFNLDAENVKSFYELKDFDMSGNEVSMDKYKGKVILVVNVSSLCGLTPINYPEMTQLDEKYRDQGLEILAFPCNQFASQEPGTHEEIMEFVKQYNCKFPFFEKHDVNGAHARPVFTYLKAKLPGSFGNYVKWNFTKFLVDRNGQPFKRFAPTDKPFSFEEDIKTLLAQKPADAPAATE